MSRVENLRVAFTKIFESNKARKAELRALRTKHNIPGSNLTSAEIGHRAGRAVAAYKSPWTPAGSKGAHQGITDLAKKYGKQAKTNPNWSSQSSAELDKDADETYRGVERAEKGEPTSFTTGIKRGILTGRKIIKKAMGENIMNYRQSLRVLFEAVIEEAAVRTPKKVRGALEKDERGIATQDGPEELVGDIKKRHPEDSPIGEKARKMAFQYRQERGEAAEKKKAEEYKAMRRRYLGVHNPKD